MDVLVTTSYDAGLFLLVSVPQPPNNYKREEAPIAFTSHLIRFLSGKRARISKSAAVRLSPFTHRQARSSSLW